MIYSNLFSHHFKWKCWITSCCYKLFQCHTNVVFLTANQTMMTVRKKLFFPSQTRKKIMILDSIGLDLWTEKEGPNLDKKSIWLSKPDPIYENYTKLHFDAKLLKMGLNRGDEICGVHFFKEVPFLVNIRCCPNFLDYALEDWKLSKKSCICRKHFEPHYYTTGVQRKWY